MSFIIILLTVGVVGVIWMLNYNGIVKLKNFTEEAGGQIDVQLQRRGELIPNLVETVKGYAKHEQETLSAVIEARNAMTNSGDRSEAVAASDAVSGALGRLFAVAEAYPDLKADTSFVALQEELTATENKIAYARQLFNTNATSYNTKIETFPGNLFAKIHGFKRTSMLAVPEESKAPVKVQF